MSTIFYSAASFLAAMATAFGTVWGNIRLRSDYHTPNRLGRSATSQQPDRLDRTIRLAYLLDCLIVIKEDSYLLQHRDDLWLDEHRNSFERRRGFTPPSTPTPPRADIPAPQASAPVLRGLEIYIPKVSQVDITTPATSPRRPIYERWCIATQATIELENPSPLQNPYSPGYVYSYRGLTTRTRTRTTSQDATGLGGRSKVGIQDLAWLIDFVGSRFLHN